MYKISGLEIISVAWMCALPDFFKKRLKSYFYHMTLLSYSSFFSLQIGILMSELNNVWRDVQRGPPDPFLVSDELNVHVR